VRNCSVTAICSTITSDLQLNETYVSSWREGTSRMAVKHGQWNGTNYTVPRWEWLCAGKNKLWTEQSVWSRDGSFHWVIDRARVGGVPQAVLLTDAWTRSALTRDLPQWLPRETPYEEVINWERHNSPSWLCDSDDDRRQRLEKE